MHKKLLVDAKVSLPLFTSLNSNTKNKILIEMANKLLANTSFILKENHKDML